MQTKYVDETDDADEAPAHVFPFATLRNRTCNRAWVFHVFHVRLQGFTQRVQDVLDLASLGSYGIERARVVAVELRAPKGRLVAQLVAGGASDLGHVVEGVVAAVAVVDCRNR